MRNAIQRLSEFVSGGDAAGSGGAEEKEREGGEEEWDWGSWEKHFAEVDEQERIVSILKSQLADAVNGEDYEDASSLKVAIAALATKDAVGRVMSILTRAIEEERYQDAAFVRDFAGAGLVGWWSGISEGTEHHGVIIRISAEHGRYVARSYSPRQLAAATAGLPLFEIFLTINKRGEYKQQAVYLKRTRASREFPILPSKLSTPPGSLSPLESTDKTDLLSGTEDVGDGEDEDDDSDIAESFSGFDNVLRDIIPVVKVKVLKVTSPAKVDREMLSKMVEQTIEEEDEGKDNELESADRDNEDFSESDNDQNDIDMDAGGVILDGPGRSEMAVKVVVGDLVQNLSDGQLEKHVIRVPARLEQRGRLSFSFTVESDKPEVTSGKGQSLRNKKPKLLDRRNMDSVMSEFVKGIARGKLPTKVLKDFTEVMMHLSLKQSWNRQVLSGSTTFNRIMIPSSPDPLNGLYIGTHGLYSSEVIHLRRKYGHWKADGGNKEHPNLEFYEYVEAVKLTGDPYVPAGQVAFRAKIGKRYQLPHKGIIPEEFGVIARYKGQGRIAERGYQKPRWADGELVILDGKYIKGGPVVGFVYWAPEHQFLIFFNRLRLQQ